jgi:hypothetical protein
LSAATSDPVSSHVTSKSATTPHPSLQPCHIQSAETVTNYFVSDSGLGFVLHGPRATPWQSRYVTDCDVFDETSIDLINDTHSTIKI